MDGPYTCGSQTKLAQELSTRFYHSPFVKCIDFLKNLTNIHKLKGSHAAALYYYPFGKISQFFRNIVNIFKFKDGSYCRCVILWLVYHVEVNTLVEAKTTDWFQPVQGVVKPLLILRVTAFI